MNSKRYLLALLAAGVVLAGCQHYEEVTTHVPGTDCIIVEAGHSTGIIGQHSHVDSRLTYCQRSVTLGP